MLCDRGYRVRVQVAGETHLERDAALHDIIEQGGILTQPGAVADTLRAALVQRLMNRVRPVPFPSMAGAGHPVRRGVLERRRMLPRGMSPLGAREIERHHARAPVLRRRARQLE